MSDMYGGIEMKERLPAYSGSGAYAFISYSHKDSRVVYTIIEQLIGSGYNIWYDEGIPLIADYGSVLYEQIKRCCVFVLFISCSSVCSEDVEKEVKHAIGFRKNIVRIVIDEDAELPPSLAYHSPATLQYLPINTEPNEFYRKVFAALAACKDEAAREVVREVVRETPLEVPLEVPQEEPQSDEVVSDAVADDVPTPEKAVAVDDAAAGTTMTERKSVEVQRIGIILAAACVFLVMLIGVLVREISASPKHLQKSTCRRM